MSNFDLFVTIFFTFANLVSLVFGLVLIKDGIDYLVVQRDAEGLFPLIAGAVCLAMVAYVAGMGYGVLATPALLGATVCDWEARMKVKQLLKEGKIYDYSLREATNDAHQMANEYHCRAFVIDVDGTGDFDVVLTAPEDDTLIMRVVWPYKWVEDSKTS